MLDVKIVKSFAELDQLFILLPESTFDKKELNLADFAKELKSIEPLNTLALNSKTSVDHFAEEISSLKRLKDGDTFIFAKTKISFVKLKNNSYESGSHLASFLTDADSKNIGCILSDQVNLQHFLEACILKQAKIETYKLKQEEQKDPILHIVQADATFLKSDAIEDTKHNNSFSQEDVARLLITCEGVLYARKLSNRPPNLLRPSDMEQEAFELAKLGVKVHVLKGQQIEKMGCLRGVGQGSTDEPRLIVLEWKPVSGASVGLVGKGVTFDSGGYSIKTPSTYMEDMKADMSGAGLVLSTIRTAAKLQLQRNIVGCLPCVENMISGNSYRPGDVLTSLSGKTVEVLNTDAEGRLILADALTYMQENFDLSCLLDFATLTGAIVVALGEITSGFFCNDDELANLLKKASNDSGEPIWQMPLSKDYDKLLDSDIADMKNISGTGGAGSITAAQFLGRFVQEKTRWAHFDIAGTAYTKAGSIFSPKHGSGVCLRMLLSFLD